MAFKFVVLAAVLAVANAGYIGAPAPVAYGGYAAPAAVAYGHPSVAVATPAITSQHQNTLRSYGNLGQVSTYSKTIDTPYSSVRKSDVRVSNDALAYAPAAVHAAPAYAHAAYAAPAYAAQTYAAPAYAAQTYAAPAAYGAYHAAAPVVAARPAYAAPAVAYGAAPVLAKTAAIPAHGSLLGVAYSAAPAVAHMTFNGYGVNYGW